jgi:MarR family transcriptional regulator for hemolysin
VLHYDFEESIGFWLVRAWNAYERALNAELTPRGITFRQAQVLGFLALDGDLSQVELAERIKVEPPTLVGILDRMERDGWITRIDCVHDRRKKLIRPTPQAEPIWAEIVDVAVRVRSRAVDGLSSDEVRLLMSLLGQVEKNLAVNQMAEEKTT